MLHYLPLNKVLRLLFSLSILALLISCGGLHVPHPKAPPANPLPELDDSIIQAPVAIPFEGLRHLLEEQVPKSQSAEKDWSMSSDKRFGVKWRVWREPFVVSISNDILTFSSTVHLAAAACLRIQNPFGKSECAKLASFGWDGQAPRDLPLSFSIPLRFDHYGNWQGSSTYNIPDIPFSLSGIGDIGQQIGGSFFGKLDATSKILEERIKYLCNPRRIAERLWNHLYKPIPLYAGLFLDLQPRGIFVMPPKISESGVVLALGVRARPRVISTPNDILPPVLPDLVVGIPQGGFHVSMEADVRYTYASDMLTKTLADLKQIKDKPVRINSVTLEPFGEKLLIGVGFSGLAKGKLYLEAKPMFDTESETISMAGVDFSVETKNVLLKAADWLLHDTLLRLIEQKARFKLTRSLDQAQKMASKEMNRSLATDVQLKGSLGQLRFLGFALTNDAIVARAAADGELVVVLTPEP